jgi:hypothetical protein
MRVIFHLNPYLINYICLFSLEMFKTGYERTNSTVLTIGGFSGVPKLILNGNEAIYLSSCAAHLEGRLLHRYCSTTLPLA